MMASPSIEPRRGDIWLVAFGAARRGEPSKHRPAVVVSSDRVLAGTPNELIVVVPLSSSLPASPLRPGLPRVAGLDRGSCANCAGVRGVARSRLLQRYGALPGSAMAEIERVLALVLDIGAGG